MKSSPQLEPNAVQHLCDTLRVDIIIVDSVHETRLIGIRDRICVLKLPCYSGFEASSITRDYTISRTPDPPFFFHTSGTSSGLPKPIAQSNTIVSSMPRLETTSQIATFTTTPLYHGGLADCLRSWTSGAMIWFFSEGLLPVTAINIVSAVSFARDRSLVPVGYFSSVPYILQMLTEEEKGVQLLQTMDLVGVGGAALPLRTGEKLVNSGVNLLSRFGSAECGFLLSSHRNYSTDKEWRYLRLNHNSKHLEFEDHQDELWELVVKPDWPCKSIANRKDGSYATSDLFKPHLVRPNAWLYHSRADAQITLANGKKFDPAPIEANILSLTELLHDVYVFGTGRPCAGAILFNSSNLTPEELVGIIWPRMHEVNSISPGHARLGRSMLVVVPMIGEESPLKKSSKGTTLRNHAEETYATTIESVYCVSSSIKAASDKVSDGELFSTVMNCFVQVLGRPIDPHLDLYRQGVDSIACIQVRKLIESRCLAQPALSLPLNVIYDQRTVAGLTSYVRRTHHFQKDEASKLDTTFPLKHMHELANKYRVPLCVEMTKRKHHDVYVVLTGATGFLGSHILRLLCEDDGVEQVCCLVRAPTPREARERVSRSLESRGWSILDHFSQLRKVVCLPCNIEKEALDLSEQDRSDILKAATVFIHAAWTVNFNLHLNSFEGQLAGTRNLIEIAIQGHARFVFISSTAAVSSSRGLCIPESVSEDASNASPLAYSRSKWIAERICSDANGRISASSARSLPISVVRIGQLCGDKTGAWNTNEAYPLMLSTAAVTGTLPNLPHEVLDWVPVHVAAQIVLEISLSSHDVVPAVSDSSHSTKSRTPCYHLSNPHGSPSWKQMLQWISEESGESCLTVVPPAVWVRQLETLPADHPSLRLLGLWKHAFGEDKILEARTRKPIFDVSLAWRISPTMRGTRPLDRDSVLRMWHWIQENVGSVQT